MRKIKRYVPDVFETTISQVLDVLFQLSMELWEFLVELWQRFLFILSIFNWLFPNANQAIQLSCVYFFAVLDLLVNILPNLLIFEIPDWLENILEQFVSFLSNDIVMRLTDPDIMYFATIIILDLLIERKLFKLSKLVRYNILLVFALLMLQGITIAFWDALFNRQILESAADWCWDDGAFIHTDKELLIIFFTITFFTYVGIYIYCWFISAFYGNFPIFGQKFLWLTDSIFFWLKIRTSTMKYGKRKKK